jgi:glycosyltransferase involved in cell wall biosynthesis
MAMKVMVVSHSSVLKYHQQKLEILASGYNLEIVLVMPESWIEGGVRIRAYTRSPNLQYALGKVFKYQNNHLHFYLNAPGLVRRFNPDIVHIEEEPFSPACSQFVRAARMVGKPAIFFTWENMDRKRNPFLTPIERYCLRYASAAIAGNADAAQILRSKGFDRRIDLMPQYGVNIEDYADPKTITNRSEWRVIYAGRIVPEKGIDTLIKAIHQVEGATLILAGSGSDGYIQMVKNRIRSLDIEKRVRWAGFIDHEGMPNLLQTSDVLVLPSLSTIAWREQFGRVLIEAFAANVAVIGSDSGEIPHVIGDAGIVFKEGNASELAGALAELKRNGELYRSCIARGAYRVRSNYTNRILAAKIHSMYRSL